jgi:hypothetical protein
LSNKCKSYERNRKQKKKRRKENKNIKLDPGEPFGPVWRSSPQPRKETESVSFVSLLPR